ncbi:MAG TPA: sigma-54 dependent transcriptional regulator [Acidobacteriaceae bacterium]|nr:sigma-54 dependent transcriptional regulator [Acidobacteriaceae bacterium]
MSAPSQSNVVVPSDSPVTRSCATHPLSLLVIEDDPVLRDFCLEIGKQMGFAASFADSIPSARAVLPQPVDVVLLDVRLPGGEGLSLLDDIRAKHPSAIVIIMTAYPTVDSAVEALRTGAGDYLSKPFTVDDLALTLERAAERRIFDVESRELRERLRTGEGEGRLTGRSPGMEKLYRILSKVAFTTHPVLIVGESGTGKSVVAQAIHLNGPRAAEPFTTLECTVLTPAVMDAQLFGSAGEPPLLGRAGTIFLDEVSELPLDLQARLVRALETRQISTHDGTDSVPLAGRLLASTTRDLTRLVATGRFRNDLFYRLNVVNLRLPALRERKEDIPLLAASILERLHIESEDYHTIAQDALRLLVDYDWPGNVRELQHALERAFALSSGPVLHLGDLPTQLQNARIERDHRQPQAIAAPENLLTIEVRSIADMEKQAILTTLRQLNGDKLMAAKLLGIGKTTLYRKLKEYELTDSDV